VIASISGNVRRQSLKKTFGEKHRRHLKEKIKDTIGGGTWGGEKALGSVCVGKEGM